MTADKEWTKEREAFWTTALGFALILIAALTLALVVGIVTAHGNLSVYSYGTNYIIWDVGGNTLVWLDGTETQVSGLTYGQYDLQPNTEHIACNIDGNCTGIVTKTDSWTVLNHWLAYFVILIFTLACMFYPIAFFAAIPYVGYLVTTYMPDSGASGNEYVIVACFMALTVMAAVVGYRRGD